VELLHEQQDKMNRLKMKHCCINKYVDGIIFIELFVKEIWWISCYKRNPAVAYWKGFLVGRSDLFLCFIDGIIRKLVNRVKKDPSYYEFLEFRILSSIKCIMSRFYKVHLVIRDKVSRRFLYSSLFQLSNHMNLSAFINAEMPSKKSLL